ncbi:MAG: hypothetical protein AAGH68_07960 [Pseudomonadota bacterium]
MFRQTFFTLKTLLVAAVLMTPLPGLAGPAYEPKRGTAERKQLMNAARPFAEENLGKPVQFVVETLRVDGRVGYAFLTAQRPGGKAINMRDTPFSRKFGYDPNTYPGMAVTFSKTGGRWVFDGGEISPFEPLTGPRICAKYKTVLSPGLC